MKDATLKQVVKFLETFGDLSAEKMQEILGSGLLADLRDGDVKNVNRDEVRKLLGLSPLTKQPVQLLEYLGSITIYARNEKFNQREHFVVDTSETAKVKISFLGNNFESNFLDKVEESNAETVLHYGKLNRGSVDGPIIAELGGVDKCETTLAEMFSLMEMQPKGEAGALLTNGWWNIFYIKDRAGVLCAVRCHWDGGGWNVFASSVDGPSDWGAVGQLFSRNSFAPQN